MQGAMEEVSHRQKLNGVGKKSAEVCSLTTESLCGLEQDKHLPGSQFLSCEVKESVE